MVNVATHRHGMRPSAALPALALASCLALAECKPLPVSYCIALGRNATASECSAYAFQVALERTGHAVITAPATMTRGAPDTVTVKINALPRQPLPLSNDAGETASNETAANATAPTNATKIDSGSTNSAAQSNSAGTANTNATVASADEAAEPMPNSQSADFSTTVGPHMKVDLTSDGTFKVKSTSPEQLRLSMEDPYPPQTWTWEVIATQGGVHTLTVTTTVQAVDQNNKLRDVDTSSRAYSFNIVVSPTDQLLDDIKSWPDWIKAVTAILTALTALVAAALGLRKGLEKWGPQAGRRKRD